MEHWSGGDGGLSRAVRAHSYTTLGSVRRASEPALSFYSRTGPKRYSVQQTIDSSCAQRGCVFDCSENCCDEIAVKWIVVKTRSSSSILQGAVLLQREPVYCGSKLSATLTRGPARLTTTCQVHSFQTLGFISVIRGYFKVTAPLSMEFEFT